MLQNTYLCDVNKLAYTRKAYQDLVDWKTLATRKPLILRGARQVGKTTLVNQFSKEYKRFISLNLERSADIAFFNEYDTTETLVQALKLTYGISALENTLLFIDEIQESPKAIALLRYLYEEYPELHIIAAGSLLEFALADVPSFPVGRVSYLNIYPFDFDEYLIAQSNEPLLEAFNTVPIPEFAHNKLLSEFHTYTMVGGMPEAVQTYLTTQDASKVSTVLSQIWETYKSDVEKYAKNDSQKQIIRHIMNTAGLEKDRFSFANFGGSSYSSRDVGESFRALELARIFKIVYPTTDMEFPMMPNLKKRPRLQFLDVGLLNSSINLYIDYLNMHDLNDMHRGKVAQQMVVQELVAQGAQRAYEPHFWVREKSDANAEVDLIHPYKNKLYPVEIKSGKTGSLKSLHQFVDKTQKALAVRLYAGKYSVEKTNTPNDTSYTLLNIPYYHTSRIGQYLDLILE